MTNIVIAACSATLAVLSLAAYVVFARWVARRHVELARCRSVPTRSSALYDWAVEIPDLVPHPGAVERHLDQLPGHGLR